jgi:hypothetical protein
MRNHHSLFTTMNAHPILPEATHFRLYRLVKVVLRLHLDFAGVKEVPLLPSPFQMLYRVRLQYGIVVTALSAEDAVIKVKAQIRDYPSSVISSVEDALQARPRPLWKRLLTGR